MVRPLEKVLKDARSWFPRSPDVGLSVIEDARFLSANDGRRLKALDRFLEEAFDADRLQQVHRRVEPGLERVFWWIKSSSFGDDLWLMAFMQLRSAYALSVHQKRRFKIEEPPLLTEAFAGLGEASHDFRDPLYIKYLSHAGPLLTALIEELRRDERGGGGTGAIPTVDD